MDLHRRDVLLGLLGLGVTGCFWSCTSNAPSKNSSSGFVATLAKERQQALAAAANRLFPGAVEAGFFAYLDYWLQRAPFSTFRHTFEMGAQLLNRAAQQRHQSLFSALNSSQQAAILLDLKQNKLHAKFNGANFFERLFTLILESMFGDPKYGGNRNQRGWTLANYHPCWWAPHGRFNLKDPRLPY